MVAWNFHYPLQKLLLDGIGLTIEDMRRLARWHGRVIDPALANATASVLVARKLAARRAEKRKESRKTRLSEKVLGQSICISPTCCCPRIGNLRVMSRMLSKEYLTLHTGCAQQ